MPTVAFRLIPATVPGPVQAGYLPGTDTSAWLVEMARHPQARCFIVPSTIEEANAGGLLLITVGHPPSAFSPRVVPCAIAFDRIVVPSDMTLTPALTQDEITHWLVFPWYFFHPVLGLIAYEDSDAIKPEALIVPPLSRMVSWLHAQPGRPPAPRLTRIELLLPANDHGMLGTFGGEIGSRSPEDLTKNAPPIERLRALISKGVRKIALPLLGTLGAATRQLGARVANRGTTKAPHARQGPIDRLGAWSAAQMEKLLQHREHELARLLQLLQKNPDEGLRYAIPLAQAGDADRGQAPPSWDLHARDPRFPAARGRGPVDAWTINPKTQWQLQQQYRQLANRELAVPRFDRAAYIFAHLLGDWRAAAGALARGGWHQEAARIYLDRLKNTSLAAQCLEEGGLLPDAVVLYGQLGQHEKCGDLLRLLGREPEAVTAYREALKASSDRLHDARLLFTKLNQPDLALRVLASGYPHSPQARLCLERHFEYLDQLHATEACLALAQSLENPSHRLADPTEMTEALGTIHRNQRDPDVRRRLEIVAMRLIGETIAAGTAKAGPLLSTLPQFASSDRLFKRDCQRFADLGARDRRRHDRPPSDSHPTGALILTLQARGKISLPPGPNQWIDLLGEATRWLAVGWQQGTGQDIWVLGHSDAIIGCVTSAAGLKRPTAHQPILLPNSDTVWLPTSGPDGSARYNAARPADFTSGSTTADMTYRLDWLPLGILAVCADSSGLWIAHLNTTGTFDLSFHDYRGNLIRTHALAWASSMPKGSVCLAVHGDIVLLSVGPHLIQLKNGTVASQIDCPSDILKLQATQHDQPPAFLVLTLTQAQLAAPGANGHIVLHTLLHVPHESSPLGCLLTDARIAVGTNRSCLIHAAHPRTRLIQSLTLDPPAPGGRGGVVGYAPWGSDSIAALSRDGSIQWFQ